MYRQIKFESNIVITYCNIVLKVTSLQLTIIFESCDNLSMFHTIQFWLILLISIVFRNETVDHWNTIGTKYELYFFQKPEGEHEISTRYFNFSRLWLLKVLIHWSTVTVLCSTHLNVIKEKLYYLVMETSRYWST
jgi:hypothetical protein